MDKKRIARVLILTALILIAFYLWTRRRAVTAFAATLPGQQPGQAPQVSLSLQGQLGFPECFGTYDKVTEGEERVIFNVSSGTEEVIFSNRRDNDIEVLEVLIESVNANTFQLRKTGLVLTPVWDFAARQTYSDPGFVLRKGEDIFLSPTSATPVVGYVRFRERGTALCNTPPTVLSSPPVPIGPTPTGPPVGPISGPSFITGGGAQLQTFACPGEVIDGHCKL